MPARGKGHLPVESGHGIDGRSGLPIVQSDRRHFEAISCLCVPGAFHSTDEVEFARIDMLTPAIHDRFVMNVNEQDPSENQAEAAQQNFLHQRAFHRNRGLRDARHANTLRRCEREPGFLRLFHASWKRNRGDPHFLRESERHKIDDELLVGANVRARILGLARPFAADANSNGRGSLPKTLKKENGAALMAPLGSLVVIHAIGRGSTVASNSLYRSGGDISLKSNCTCHSQAFR